MIRDFYKTNLGSYIISVFQSTLIPKLDRLPTLWLGFADEHFLSRDDVIGSELPLEEDKQNFACDYHDLPFESMSYKQVVLWHVLEKNNDPKKCLEEVWDVLDGEGKVFIIVPNRLGVWASSDKTPFGHGMPYSTGQIKKLLNDVGFEPISLSSCLYNWPSQKKWVLKTAPFSEWVGRYFFSPFGGALIVEAKKKIYRATLTGENEKNRAFTVQPVSI